MTASNRTVELVYAAVKRHVTDAQLTTIIDELLQIPGGQSFRDTVRKLAAIDAKQPR